MSVSREQALRNVRTATIVQARALGYLPEGNAPFLYNALTAVQQVTLTNALATYISTRPELFDTGETSLVNPYLSARHALNLPPVDSSAYLVGGFVDAVLENAREINPLDPQNIGSNGQRIFWGVVIVGTVAVLAYTAPRWLSALRSRAS